MSRFVTWALVLLCSGCAFTDPYERQGMWQPSGVVDGNLAAMVADPRDLISGHGDPSLTPHEANSAVERLWLDHTKPFIGSELANQANSPSGGGSAAPTGMPSLLPPSSTAASN